MCVTAIGTNLLVEKLITEKIENKINIIVKPVAPSLRLQSKDNVSKNRLLSIKKTKTKKYA